MLPEIAWRSRPSFPKPQTKGVATKMPRAAGRYGGPNRRAEKKCGVRRCSCPAPKGASDLEELVVSLKRYPDTKPDPFKPEFSAADYQPSPETLFIYGQRTSRSPPSLCVHGDVSLPIPAAHNGTRFADCCPQDDRLAAQRLRVSRGGPFLGKDLWY